MNSLRTLPGTLLALALGLVPLRAQSALFADGTAVGGSKVFSEGANPLGAMARLDKPAYGWRLGWVDGDAKASDQKGALERAVGTDPGLASAGLVDLGRMPWTERVRAYGLADVREGGHFSLSREDMHGQWAATDLNPAHLGSTAALTMNGSALVSRHAVVDRLVMGGWTRESGFSAGMALRVERWSDGLRWAAYSPMPGQPGWRDPAVDLLGFSSTDRRTLAYALDLSLLAELAPGVRAGLTADHVNPKRLWDVYERMQVRAGIQADVGTMAKVSLEHDLNDVQRMPFAVRQRTSAASLRILANPTLTFVVGAERRKLEGADAVLKAGVTVLARLSSMEVGFGLQLSKDRPVKAVAVRFE